MTTIQQILKLADELEGARANDVEMHSTEYVEDGNLFSSRLRVPGGWVYRSYDKSNSILGACFVPWAPENANSTAKLVSAIRLLAGNLERASPACDALTANAEALKAWEAKWK